MVNEWLDVHQDFEKKWHGDCINSYWEETKQLVYAKKIGLTPLFENGKYPVYDLKGISVCDIGGGPYSILLKAINRGYCLVVDPCEYPEWIRLRYDTAFIASTMTQAETFTTDRVFDEVWIYNCLQHTTDPQRIIQNARSYSKVIRIFEWVDNGISIGHPQDLKADLLNEWLGGIGKVEQLNENGCKGKAYYGIFKGQHYET
jgi:hypothetical protein